MAVLLYCVTQPSSAVNGIAGVCDSAVQSHETAGLRVYWSEIADPEACLGSPESLKKAAGQCQQVLREILGNTTPIPFQFPMLVEDADALEQQVAAGQETYHAVFGRIGDAVQYEVAGSWAADEHADLATPVKGSEYVKRRQEATARIAAIDSKLKTVTVDAVKEWRSRQERKTHRWFALVPRDGRELFIACLKSAGPSEGVRLRLSGPWPPSEFIKP